MLFLIILTLTFPFKPRTLWEGGLVMMVVCMRVWWVLGVSGVYVVCVVEVAESEQCFLKFLRLIIHLW